MRIPSVPLSISKQQPAAASILECQKSVANVESCELRKLQQSIDSNEISLLKGKGDRERVLHSEQERDLSEKQNLHEYLEREARRALQGECIAQRRLSEAEVEMDRKVGRGEILIWLFPKPIVNLNHSKWSYIMQTSELVKLKWKTEEYLKN